MSDRRSPMDNSNAYVGTGYGMPHQAVPWGVQAPATGQDRPAEQRAARELELATTAADNRGLGRLGAGATAVVVGVASAAALWILGGVIGFSLAIATGVVAIIFGLRARRAAKYTHNLSWWTGTAAIALVVASLVGCLTYNVLVPDKSRGTGLSCVQTSSCPRVGQ